MDNYLLKSDMQLVNLSESGAGQEYIYSSIIDKLQTIEHSKIGLVVAGSVQRLDVTIRYKLHT